MRTALEFFGPTGAALIGGAIMGLVVSFAVINIGLRLLPEGRAFLAAARREGRLLAHPGLATHPRVQAVFAVAFIGATITGVLTYRELAALLEPVIWPSGRRIAGGTG